MTREKHIPSFMWGGVHGFEEFDLEKAKKVAASVMPRRGRQFTPVVASMFDSLFQRTRHQRIEVSSTGRETVDSSFGVNS